MKSEKKEQTNQAETEKQAWQAPKYHEIEMKGVTFYPLDLLTTSGPGLGRSQDGSEDGYELGY